MNPERDNQGTGVQDGHGDPREIGKWARVYAQNRSLPMVAWFTMCVAVGLPIGGGSCLAAWAYRDGHVVLFVIGLMLALAGLAACTYIAIPWWGGKRFEEFAKHLYDREGNAVIQRPDEQGWRKTVVGLMLIGFLACIAVSAQLEIHGYFPHKYQQPVTAIFAVPLLIVLWMLMRPGVGWLALLWPLLFGVHALLILAGAPIVFTGGWNSLNVGLPVVGYGLLTAIIGHLYSRFALRKVKRLAQMGLPAADTQEKAR